MALIVHSNLLRLIRVGGWGVGGGVGGWVSMSCQSLSESDHQNEKSVRMANTGVVNVSTVVGNRVISCAGIGLQDIHTWCYYF